jgi:biopolymer transport protein ExbB/TolQ
VEITALLKSFIYLAASSLLLPVLFCLSVLTVWMVVYAGSFAGRWLARKRLPRPVDAMQAAAGNDPSFFSLPVRGFCRQLSRVKTGSHPDIAALNLLRETEHRMWKSLDHLKLLIRIGPGLGLIGTLIPMGTGLAALSQGDLTRLSGDLVVAFTTTVVGMALGLISYLFFTIQRRWVEADLKDMALICELQVARIGNNKENQ